MLVKIVLQHVTSINFLLFDTQLGVVLIEQGKAPQALAYLNKALEFDPDHEVRNFILYLQFLCICQIAYNISICSISQVDLMNAFGVCSTF